MESNSAVDDIRVQKRSLFIRELSSLINRHSMENEWDMPDFIMAELITDFIYGVSVSMKKNLDWHGVDNVCHPQEPRVLENE